VSADQLNWMLNLFLSMQLSIAVLVIVSIGLAVVFGMMGIINLAHGEFLMLGAYTTLVGVRAGLYLWLAMVLAAATVGVFGLIVERLLIRHLYGRLADSMLATWGLSLIMAQGMVLIFGPSTQGIATPTGSMQIGSYSVAYYSLVLVGAEGYAYGDSVRCECPFPCSIYYDLKAWRWLCQVEVAESLADRGRILFWNIGA